MGGRKDKSMWKVYFVQLTTGCSDCAEEEKLRVVNAPGWPTEILKANRER